MSYPQKKHPPANDSLQSSLLAGGAAVGTLVGIGVAATAMLCYRRVPPNKALCVYGRTIMGTFTGAQMKRTLTGGGAFVVPVLQSASWLQFTPMPLEVSLKGALSLEKIRLDVPSVFTVAIGKEPAVLENATVRLLDLAVEDVRLQAEEIILGQLRQVVATLTIEEINQDRQRFMDEISSHCSNELNKIGLELLNVNITNIDDNDGVIKAMGRNAAAKAVEKANVEPGSRRFEPCPRSTQHMAGRGRPASATPRVFIVYASLAYKNDTANGAVAVPHEKENGSSHPSVLMYSRRGCTGKNLKRPLVAVSRPSTGIALEV